MKLRQYRSLSGQERTRRTLAVALSLAILLSIAPLRLAPGSEASAAPSQPDGHGTTEYPFLPPEKGAAFIVHADAHGVSCRDATHVERLEILKRDPNVRTSPVKRGPFTEQFSSAPGDSQNAETSAAVGRLDIVLRATAQLQSNPAAIAAFERAAAEWEALITNNITVVIDVDFGPTRFGKPYGERTLGSTSGGIFYIPSYSDVRQRLINNASNAEEQSLYNSLPTGTLPTDLGPVSQMALGSPNARALNGIPPHADPNDTTGNDRLGDAPSIGFNSNFTFDFDHRDGVTSGQIDFHSVAVHEIGHALGFTSQVGYKDLSPPEEPLRATLWDLFRFRPATASGAFQTAQRILSAGATSSDRHVHYDGGVELDLSTARPDRTGGDGEQASHWKDSRFTGFVIGIMTPTLPRGIHTPMSNHDRRAVGFFGYHTATVFPVPVPAPTSSSIQFAGAGYSAFEHERAVGVTVTRTGNISAQQSVSFSTSHGTAGASDYISVSTSIVFAPGETRKVVSIEIRDDSIAEPDETFNVVLSQPQNGATLGSPSTAVVTIRDDDSFPANSTGFTGPALQTVGEGDGQILLNVVRSGDLSRPATVSYATVNGTAISTSDYGYTAGTLRFAPNETAKSITVLINDDAYVEGDETFHIELSLPVGTTLTTANSIVTVSIRDNDGGGGQAVVNPLAVSGGFVGQHYADFLSRRADAGGLDFWSQAIESCGANAQCRQANRVNVSAAFYLSIEFQETGYLVYRLHKAAFGNAPNAPVPVRFQEFLRDTGEISRGVVVGLDGWPQHLEANKTAFINALVESGRFKAAFPSDTTPAQLVDDLNRNAGLVLTQGERDGLVAHLAADNTTRGRAAVLRAVAEHSALKAAEFNKAFVLMQYFGYLRRDPNSAPDSDYAGFQFWLEQLNRQNGDYVRAELVRAFIESIEYNRRFAP